MICPHCNQALPDDSLFCQFCGKKIERQAEEIQPVRTISIGQQNTGLPINNKKKTITWVLGALVIVLFGCSIALMVNRNNLSHKYSYVAEQLEIANQSIVKQKATIKQNEKDIQAAKQLRDQYKDQRDKYKVTSEYFTTIQKWVKEHGAEYNKNKSFRAWTNVIAVKVGETVNLDIYYTGNRWRWLSRTNKNCSAEWSEKWSGNTSQVNVTGIKVGVTELIFKLGDSKKSDTEESFRVLVIVT